MAGVVGAEGPVPGVGTEHQLPQQGGRRLQHGGTVQSIGVVQEAAHKAHALCLPLFAHRGLQGTAVQLVQNGGEGFHIRVLRGAPAEHHGQQRLERGLFTGQGQQELHPQHAGFEFLRLHRRQMDAGQKLCPGDLNHSFTIPFLMGTAKVSTSDIIQRFDGFDTRKTKKDWRRGGLLPTLTSGKMKLPIFYKEATP